MRDYLYEKEKADNMCDAVNEWFEAGLNDLILEYAQRTKQDSKWPGVREEAKEWIVRALKNL